MVQKHTKYGVHSGNTLRASNSRYTRRYRRQSFLVRKINNAANVSLLEKFNVSFDDVAYSLNKKGRWALPQKLKETVLFRQSTDDETKLQITERHKLKRDTNCLGFYCSKGLVRKIVPKRKTYFNVASIKSLICPPRSEDSDEVSTDEDNEPETPVVAVDIFHPCPKSSSIIHNMKYIRSASESFESTRFKNHKMKRRNRKTSHLNKSFLGMDAFAEEFDFSEEEAEEFDDELDKYIYSSSTNQRGLTFFTAADVLESAKKTKSLCAVRARTRRWSSEEDIGAKSKIIRIQELPNNEKQNDMNDDFVPSQIPEKQSQTMVPAKVILPTRETQPEYLKFIYGEKYVECRSFPRTFLIDITSEVQNLAKRATNLKSNAFGADLTTILVFMYDLYSPCSEGDVFNLYLNVNVDAESIKLSTLPNFYQGSLEDVIHRAVSQFKLYDIGSFKSKEKLPKGTQATKFEVLKSCHFESSDSNPFQEEPIKELFMKNSLAPTETTGQLGFESIPQDVCYICFDAVGENNSAIALDTCGHWFCLKCWKQHLLNKINRGKTDLLCPEYDCDEKVDITVLPQVLNIKDVVKHLQRKHENDSQANHIYCPNKKCGRMVKVCKSTTKHMNAVCECGTEFCTACMKLAHWPAPCEVSSKYWDLLRNKGINLDYNTCDGPDVNVVGKNCPVCRRFIEKNGGCYYMECVCKARFCWGCRQTYPGHVTTDICHQWKHGDRLNTVKKKITTQFDLKKLENESSFIQVAVKNRMSRKTRNMSTMKNKARRIIFRTKSLGRRPVQKITELLADDETTKHLTSIPTKLELFLQNIIKLYFELSHLAEYTAIFTQMQKKADQQKLNYIIERLEKQATEIFAEFTAEDNKEILTIIENICEIRFQCVQTVSGLVNLINKFSR